jgi:predicted nucleic acid-binding protein
MHFLLDVNVLLALSLPNHQHHGAATEWFDRGRQWATTPITETAYLRLLVNPLVVGYDIAPAQAIDALGAMRQLAGHTFVASLAGASQVTDHHLINLAAINGLILATFDGSLSRAVSSADRKHIQVLSDRS